jgi:hypothetical protein
MEHLASNHIAVQEGASVASVKAFPITSITAYMYNLVPIRATCTVHLILLYSIILIILDEGHKLWSSFLHPPIASSLFGPNILTHPQSVFLPYRQTQNMASV